MGMLFKRVTLLSAFLFAATAAAATRPNIVFIMLDDLDMSVWNTALLTKDKTTGAFILPNIKSKLIEHGTTFENVFASQSLCCPSRTTFHTGQYPHNHGVTSNPNEKVGLAFYPTYRDRESGEKKAIGLWLKEAGHLDGTYWTGHFGKYLNGSGENQYHVPAGWDVWRALIPKTQAQCMYGYTLSNTYGEPETFGDNKKPAGKQDPKHFQTDKLADLAALFIQDAPSEQPFLLVLTPTAPHTESCLGDKEIRTAPRYKDMTPRLKSLPAASLSSYNEGADPLDEALTKERMKDKPEWIRKRPVLSETEKEELRNLFNDKIASLRPVDDMVKTVMEALKTKGVLGNTLIILTSDNGYQYGTHRLVGKEDVYEESIRLPMVVKAPGQTTKQTQQAWVMNNDWAKTIAEYAEVTPLLTVDGREFRSLLASESATNGRHTMLIRNGANPAPGSNALSEHHHPFLAVRTRDTTLIGNQATPTTLVYVETYNYLSGDLEGVELYDLATDPLQENSLHASTDRKRVNQMARLKQRLLDLKACSGDTCKQHEGLPLSARKAKN